MYSNDMDTPQEVKNPETQKIYIVVTIKYCS